MLPFFFPIFFLVYVMRLFEAYLCTPFSVQMLTSLSENFCVRTVWRGEMVSLITNCHNFYRSYYYIGCRLTNDVSVLWS